MQAKKALNRGYIIQNNPPESLVLGERFMFE